MNQSRRCRPSSLNRLRQLTSIRPSSGWLMRLWPRRRNATSCLSHSSERAPMALERQELYPEVVDDLIYVAGGLLNPNTGVSAHFDAYDPVADAWQRLATLPQARHRCRPTPTAARRVVGCWHRRC